MKKNELRRIWDHMMEEAEQDDGGVNDLGPLLEKTYYDPASKVAASLERGEDKHGRGES